MKNTLALIAILFISLSVQAQFIKKKEINAQVGYGLSSPYNSIDNIVDDGIFAQGEMVLTILSWVEIRPYAGFLWTSSNGKDADNNPTIEKAETTAVLIGAKTRIRAPIPWVAPYAEIGLGTSIGKFETFTAFDNIDKSGIIYHIPFSFGLELGKNNKIDLGFTYYFQPSVEQFVGAVAVGITFPMNNEK